jgi:Flp pilus assembly protein TadD
MKFLVALSLGLGLSYYFIVNDAPDQTSALPATPIPVYCAPSMDWSKMKDDHGPLIKAFTLTNFKISSSVDSAQLYFDQGLSQLYAFNHGEAGRSFKTAIRLDPSAPMPYWGLAMVLGPNYNAGLNPAALEEINATIKKAREKSGAATVVEKALIEALGQRFPNEPVTDMTPYNEAYSAAMEKLYRSNPGQADLAVLYIDALMNEHPWNFWMKDGTAQPWTAKTVATIESVLKQWPNHPGAIHYYIHATEASQHAEIALPYADRLGAMVAGNGHLVHMPSHTYIRTGDYHKGVLVNEAASESDSLYISQCNANGFYPMLLYPHNIHFLAACSFLEGNTEKAIQSAWMVSRQADKKYLADNITVQHFYSIPYYVLVQLEKWEEILRLPMPGESLIYPRALWHYARGMAYGGKKEFSKAASELKELEKIVSGKALEKQLIWDLNTAQQLVEMARLVLTAELNALQGKIPAAIPALKEAIALEDQLNYNEPPDWFFSNRLRLGSWLLKSGDFSGAEKIYSEDLQTFRENGWALHGLFKALRAQGKKAAAEEVKLRFDKAWQWADITLK